MRVCRVLVDYGVARVLENDSSARAQADDNVAGFKNITMSQGLKKMPVYVARVQENDSIAGGSRR